MGDDFLKLTPRKVIKFDGTKFDEPITSTLTLENISDKNVAFKIKTTALRAYLVRPSSAIIKPGEKIDVQVMLQKLGEVPANYVHKFLVLGLQTDETQLANRDSWQTLSKNNDKVTEYRLAVIFPDVNGGDTLNSKVDVSLVSPLADPGHKDKDINTKFKEMEQYVMRLEDQKRALEQYMKANYGNKQKKSGWQFYHIVMFIIVAIVAVKAAEKYTILAK